MMDPPLYMDVLPSSNGIDDLNFAFNDIADAMNGSPPFTDLNGHNNDMDLLLEFNQVRAPLRNPRELDVMNDVDEMEGMNDINELNNINNLQAFQDLLNGDAEVEPLNVQHLEILEPAYFKQEEPEEANAVGQNWQPINNGGDVVVANAINYMEDNPQGYNVMVNPANVLPAAHSSAASQAQAQARAQAQAQAQVQVQPPNMISPQPNQPQQQPPQPLQQAPQQVHNLNVNISNQYHNLQQQVSPALNGANAYPQQLQQLSPLLAYQQQHVQQQAGSHVQVRPQQPPVPHGVRPNVIGNSQNGVKVLPPNSTSMQQSNGAAQNGGQQATVIQASNTGTRKKTHKASNHHPEKENGYPKPGYSYSCLIALALKNSHTGHLSVSEIYKFMCDHFPYFQTAPAGWKNSVRHNLSLNKCFEKIEKPSTSGSSQRKGCLWAMNPAKVNKMDEEVLKWSRKDPMAIKKGMVRPNTLERLERGEMIQDYNEVKSSHRAPPKRPSITETETTEEDPRTPNSLSSLNSVNSAHSGNSGQYDGSEFVDIEAFMPIPDSSLHEIQLQARGPIFEGLPATAQFGASPVSVASSVSVASPVSVAARVTVNSTVGPVPNQIFSAAGAQQPLVRLATTTAAQATAVSPAVVTSTQNAAQQLHQQIIQRNNAGGFYPATTIHGNYAIAPSPSAGATVNKRQQTLVVARQEGKVFAIGEPILS